MGKNNTRPTCFIDLPGTNHRLYTTGNIRSLIVKIVVQITPLVYPYLIYTKTYTLTRRVSYQSENRFTEHFTV